MNQISSHFRQLGDAPSSDRRPLGQLLIESDLVSVGDLLPALGEHKKLKVPLGAVLTAHGYVDEKALYDILARQWSIPRANLQSDLDPSICRKIGLDYCLRHRALPLCLKNGVLLLAVSGMEMFSTAESELEETYGLISPVVASRSEIDDALGRVFHDELAERSATDVPVNLSCRGLAAHTKRRSAIAGLLIGFLLSIAAYYPVHLILILTVISILLSLSSAALKSAALATHLWSKRGTGVSVNRSAALPKVSIMVPLHKEPDIASALIDRLSRLTYPKPLLEILLVIEENDHVTRNALEGDAFPPWMRPVYVPEGEPKTKPRALNHAYKFCSGDIIGIYDAEDAPEPDQIDKVVAKFASSPPEVACLQGILQFYNPTQNWLARCFTMDYAAWFRVILPGISRLKLPVPLGGTTLFIKRHVVDEMHGWDAHNVTEDADLGLRLNRAGYRTELIDTITDEEANCHGWRWIRQRSRWIKGYMVTYWAHMRAPISLFQDLGLRAFVGFQILFLGTILHFMTAPILWSFWLVYFGIEHTYFNNVPPTWTAVTAISFLLVEGVGMAIVAIACAKANRRFLIPWIPTMSFYFLLAVPAGIKALWEFFRAPVYWDKTDHGHSLPRNS